MATFREQLLAEAKKRLEDKLALRPQEIESQISKRKSDLLARDVEQQRGARDILTGLSSKFGGPGTQEAGLSFQRERESQFKRQREEILSFQRMQAMNNFFNQRYQYALNRYQNAGYNLRQSEEFSKQWALQQTKQAFQEEMSELGRQGALEKERISQEFYNSGLGLKQQFEDRYDPYQEAMIRSLVGITPYLGYYGYLRSQDRPIQKDIPRQSVAGQGGYLPYEQYYYPAISERYGRTAGT